MQRTIYEFDLNPGKEDIERVIGLLLAIPTPVYAVGESSRSAKDDDGEYHITRYNITRMRRSNKGAMLSTAEPVGRMWARNDYKKLFVESTNPVVMETVQRPKGVTLSKKHKVAYPSNFPTLSI